MTYCLRNTLPLVYAVICIAWATFLLTPAATGWFVSCWLSGSRDGTSRNSGLQGKATSNLLSRFTYWLIRLAGKRSLRKIWDKSDRFITPAERKPTAKVIVGPQCVRIVLYRKLPLISPGLSQIFVRGFRRGAYKHGGSLYPREFVTRPQKLLR